MNAYLFSTNETRPSPLLTNLSSSSVISSNSNSSSVATAALPPTNPKPNHPQNKPSTRICAVADLPIRLSNGQLMPFCTARNCPWRWVNARDDYETKLGLLLCSDQEAVLACVNRPAISSSDKIRIDFEWHARHVRNLVRVLRRLPVAKDCRIAIQGKEGLLLKKLSQVTRDSPNIPPVVNSVDSVTVRDQVQLSPDETASLRIIERCVETLLASCIKVDSILSSMGISFGPDDPDTFFPVPQASEPEQKKAEAALEHYKKAQQHPENVCLSADGCWIYSETFREDTEEFWRLNIRLPYDLVSRPWVGLVLMQTPDSESLAVTAASAEEAARQYPTLHHRPPVKLTPSPLDRHFSDLFIAECECRFLSLKATCMRERSIDLKEAIAGIDEIESAALSATSHSDLNSTSISQVYDQPLSLLCTAVSQLIADCDACLNALTDYGWNEELTEQYSRPEQGPAFDVVDGVPNAQWISYAREWRFVTHGKLVR